jgi:uncharacterized SAM-binding protein YcdF (DUF218 family)
MRVMWVIVWMQRVLTLVAVVFAMGLVLFGMAVQEPEASGPAAASADALVVFTGDDARIATAMRLLATKVGSRLLISGVNTRTSKAALRSLAPGHAELFECCVDLGHWAQDTIGNAEETRAWANIHHFRSLIVITSDYHMPRSLTELRRVLPGVALVPYPVVSSGFQAEQWWRDPQSTRLLVSEYMKFIPAAFRLIGARLMGYDRNQSAMLADPAALPRL